MIKNRNLRIFLVSMFSTLCIIALLLGLAKVDTQCRRIGFGDEKTLISQITGKNLDLACNTGEICYNNAVF
ncbi:MAG: N-acetylmuramoyl-L-alanine amidase [Oscillospiraceae bacterium]